MGEQEWRRGESSRLPPMWPGFESQTRRQMWVEFVVGSHPCAERFSPRMGEQEWRRGESSRLPPMWPGFESQTRRQMWVEFVAGSHRCAQRFPPGTPDFPSPQKPTLLNSNSIRTQCTKSHLVDVPLLIPINYLFCIIYISKTVTTDSAQRSSNKCKKYLPKNYS